MSKIKKTLLILSTIATPLAVLPFSISCQYRSNAENPTEEQPSENVDQSGSGGTSSKPKPNKPQPSGSYSAEMRVESYKTPSAQYDDVRYVWAYVKNIPNVVKNQNPSLIGEELNKKIVEQYKKTYEHIFDVVSKSYSPSFTTYMNSASERPAKAFMQRYYDSPQRLFKAINDQKDFLKELEDQEKDPFTAFGITIFLPYWSHIIQNWRASEFIEAYIKYQIALYEIKDSKKELEEQLKSKMNIALPKLFALIGQYIDPITHWSLPGDKEQFTPKNSSHESFMSGIYKEMYDLVNNELAPLAIKLEMDDSNNLSKWNNDKKVEKYVYPRMKTKFKESYSDSEIETFWNRFKSKSESQYGWKYKK